jgi:hypothetical protein
LLRALKAIEKVRTANDDLKIGVNIVRKALSWPARPGLPRDRWRAFWAARLI